MKELNEELEEKIKDADYKTLENERDSIAAQLQLAITKSGRGADGVADDGLMIGQGRYWNVAQTIGLPIEIILSAKFLQKIQVDLFLSHIDRRGDMYWNLLFSYLSIHIKCTYLDCLLWWLCSTDCSYSSLCRQLVIHFEAPTGMISPEFGDEPYVGCVATNIPPHIIDTSIKVIKLNSMDSSINLKVPAGKKQWINKV